MSRLRRRRYTPSFSSQSRHGPTLGAAVLGLALCAIALVTVVALTSADRLAQTFLSQVPPRLESVFLTTPTAVPPDAMVGADVRSVVDTTPTSDQTPLPMPTTTGADTRFAVLLMGYGGGNHDGAYLTDSMMVVIVDPARKSLTLLSLPRDSWVPMSFDGKTIIYNKVNTAYAFAEDASAYPDRLDRYRGTHGPGTFAADTVSRLLGIPIQYYLSLDFQGFRDMINAVGGINVDVPDSFAARYPANDDPSINAGWTIVRFSRGLQHMDGERAIEYARARETIDNVSEGTDFARSRRQRLIMQAFKTRLFEPGGLIHLPQLLAIAATHVDTNYQIPDATKLAQLILGWRDVTIYQTALTTGNYLEDATGPDGAYVVVPSSPDHSWAQVRAFARRLWEDPAAGVAMASTTVVVENDSDVAGLAARVSAALARLGYIVGTPISGSALVRSQVEDRTGGKATVLIQRLTKDLGLGDLEVSDPAADSADGEVVVRLGADAAKLSLAPPRDPSAPYSTVGIEKFGIWPYVPPTPTPIPALRPTPTPVPSTTAPERGPNRPGATAKDHVVVVPSLIGLPEAQAQHLITELGLMTTDVNYQTIDDVPDRRYFLSIPPGAVLSQSPRPGIKVPVGTKVLLAVRKQ
jgi:LCP family protein required for cell wall assembly